MRLILFSTALLATSIASAATPVDGWYVSAFGGYSYLPSNVNKHLFGLQLSNVRYHNGYNVGGRVGYQSNPIRYELEYTYINANPDRFRLAQINQSAVNSRASANALMANLYFDFPEILETISAFVGGGIGYSFVNIRLNGISPVDIVSFGANGNAFTYQGTTGLTYNFSENYAINAAYRYTTTTNINTFGRSFQAHMGSAGVIYRFDTCSYK